MDFKSLKRLAIMRGARQLVAILDETDELVPGSNTRDSDYRYSERKLSGKWLRMARAKTSKLQKAARKGK